MTKGRVVFALDWIEELRSLESLSLSVGWSKWIFRVLAIAGVRTDGGMARSWLRLDRGLCNDKWLSDVPRGSTIDAFGAYWLRPLPPLPLSRSFFVGKEQTIQVRGLLARA